MKIPAWAIVVAILMMLFGGCGMVSDMQQIFTPSMAELQTRMVEDMEQRHKNADTVTTVYRSATDSSSTTITTTTDPAFPKAGESMKKMLYISEYTRTWLIRFGYIGLFVSLLYLLGGLFLLFRKPFSIPLACTALVLSIALGIAQAIVLSRDTSSGFIANMYSIMQVIGIVIDVILLIVVAFVDKTSYRMRHE